VKRIKFFTRIAGQRKAHMWAVSRGRINKFNDCLGYHWVPRYLFGILIELKNWGFYKIDVGGLWSRVYGPFVVEHCAEGFWSHAIYEEN